MKKLVIMILLLITSCGITKPIYREIRTDDCMYVIDTLIKQELPDTSLWAKYRFINYLDTTYVSTYNISWKDGKSFNVLTINKYSDSEYIINYRKE